MATSLVRDMSIRLKSPDLLEEYGLECPICLQAPREPMTGPCSHVVCSSCIHQWLSQQSNCPICRVSMSKSELKPLQGVARAVFDNMEIPCNSTEGGCGEFIKLCDWANHRAKCPKRRPSIPPQLSEPETNDIPIPPTPPPKEKSNDNNFNQSFEVEDSLDLPNVKVLKETTVGSWAEEAGWSVWSLPRIFERFQEAADAASRDVQPFLESPPHQSWDQGYKYTLKLFLNGNQPWNKAYCSLMLRFIKGDNDDNLSWPFSDKIAVKLLDSPAATPVQNALNAACGPYQRYFKKPPEGTEAGFAQLCTRPDLLSSVALDCLRVGIKFIHEESADQKMQNTIPVRQGPKPCNTPTKASSYIASNNFAGAATHTPVMRQLPASQTNRRHAQTLTQQDSPNKNNCHLPPLIYTNAPCSPTAGDANMQRALSLADMRAYQRKPQTHPIGEIAANHNPPPTQQLYPQTEGRSPSQGLSPANQAHPHWSPLQSSPRPTTAANQQHGNIQYGHLHTQCIGTNGYSPTHPSISPRTPGASTPSPRVAPFSPPHSHQPGSMLMPPTQAQGPPPNGAHASRQTTQHTATNRRSSNMSGTLMVGR